MGFVDMLLEGVNSVEEKQVNKKFVGFNRLTAVRIDLSFKDSHAVVKAKPDIDITINGFYRHEVKTQLAMLTDIEKEIKDFKKRLKENE
jgi:hypothetical protein